MSKYKYIGFKIKQRRNSEAPLHFAFYANAKEIVKWACVNEVDDSPDGTQRVLREPRRKAITRFLEASEINTIPNSVLIAFPPESIKLRNLSRTNTDCNNKGETSLATIEFSATKTNKPAFIVDGQHRIFGISDFNAEDIVVLVVALVNVDLNEQAFQFIVINNKSVRVPTDNVKAIIANFDQIKLQERLLSSGVRYGTNSPMLTAVNTLDESPFKGLLLWPNTREDGTKLIPITTIEQCMKMLSKEFLILQSDEDSCLGAFLNIWSAVKKSYPKIWGKENKFMKKVSIMAVHEFLIFRLKSACQLGFINILDTSKVDKTIQDLLKKIPAEFWTSQWSVKVQDNANVRDIIKIDMEMMIHNAQKEGNSWFNNLKLIQN